MMMMMIIIIIIIRHQVRLDRPVSALSNSLFKSLPNHLRPFRLQFSITFATLQLFILVTCRSKFYLCLLSFSSAGSTFNSSQFLHSFCGRKVRTGCSSGKFYLDSSQQFLSFFLRVQISLPYKIMQTASALCTLLLENFWTKVGLKLLLRVFEKILLVAVEYPFHFGRKFHDLDISNGKRPLSTTIFKSQWVLS